MIDHFLGGDSSRRGALSKYADGARQAPEIAGAWSGPGGDEGPPFVPPPVELVR
jgi:hypothetical protein